MKQESEEQGQRLLTAVERILSDDETLIALTERYVRETEARDGESEGAWRERVATKIVSDFSTRSAISGGATALPSLVPGFGSLVTLVGGTLADMALMLKFEVEMALCLVSLYGYDIRKQRERQIAFLLASVGTYEAKTEGSFLVDLARAQRTAIWNYTPRQLSKALVSVLGKVALLAISRSFTRVLPVVGVVVGASANKVLTRKVGKRCNKELAMRRELDAQAEETEPDVRARVRRRKAGS